MVVMALVRVENVIVLGVLYLSVFLVVRNYSCSGIGGDGWGVVVVDLYWWRWWHICGGEDGDNCFKGDSCY